MKKPAKAKRHQTNDRTTIKVSRDTAALATELRERIQQRGWGDLPNDGAVTLGSVVAAALKLLDSNLPR